MVKVKNNKRFIVIILIILFSPIVFSICNLLIHKFSESKDKFRLNFKTHYFFKEELLFFNKLIKKNLFGTYLIPNRSIDLDNGWYVVGNAFNDAFLESKALKVFSKEELYRLKDIIKSQNNWLESKGIKFYIAIAPNKLTTYDTLVPIRKMSRKTKLQQLDSLCNELGVNFVNMGMKFKENDSLRLYHKTDTHWNEAGAFLGYDASMDAIKKDFPSTVFKENNLSDFNMNSSLTLFGDLNKMLKNDDKEELLKLENNSPKCAKKIQNILALPGDYHFDPKNYEMRFENEVGNLKFLSYRDSFMVSCKPFFVENFRESLFLWDYVFDQEIINKEKPDIVFFELVERNIDHLLKNKVINKSEDKIAPK